MDVPYRCPRCGDGKTFPVLSDLKQHLSVEHSYVPTPRKRVQVFNGKKGSQVISSGRLSPLLQSFHDEGKRLERELQEAKDSEMNNKLKRYGEDGQNSLNRNDLVRSVGAEFVKPSIISFQDDHVKNTLNTLTQEVSMSRLNQWKTSDALMRADEVLSNVEKAAETRMSEQRSVIEKLSESLREKEEDLRNSQEELDRLRKEQNQLIESAEILSRKTHEESQRLSEELESKEVQLSRINSQLAHLRQNSLEDWAAHQHRGQPWKSEKDAKNMMMERKMMRKRQLERDESFDHVEAETFHGLQHDRREMPFRSQGNRGMSFDEPEQENEELEILSQELRKMQREAVQKMQEKDKELIRAKKRSEKLEKDRLVLLHEMENLLSKASSDNDKLKSELKNKDEELKEFNLNLQDAKKEQSKLVGETFELYREADKNIAKLKEMMTLKDFQLKAANEKLNQFQMANEQLLMESESIAQHADEKGNIMETMLQTKEQSLQLMERELNETKYEKEKLKEEAETLKQEVAERSRSLAELQQEVEAKEKELEKTNDDLKTLQTFLQTTAAKESVARKELEKFIMELIERADKAERELRTLKKQVRAASLAKSSDESQSLPSTHIPVSLHNTLTEPVIHTTTSHLVSRSQDEEQDSRPTTSRVLPTQPSRNRSSSRKATDPSDTRNRSSLSKKPETHITQSQQETVTSPRTDAGHWRDPTDESRLAQAAGHHIADTSARNDGGVPHVVTSHNRPHFDSSELVDDSRVTKNDVIDAQMESGRNEPRELAEFSVKTVETPVKVRAVVSDMGIQTETPQVNMSQHLDPTQSGNQHLCSGCQKNELSKDSCEINMGRQSVSEQCPHPEKSGELSEKNAVPRNPNQSVCPECSEVIKEENNQNSSSQLKAAPVPIHSSTPKKSSVSVTKSDPVCKHCHHLSSAEDEAIISGHGLPKQKELESARAAVLARIMADEARMSNALQKEERVWHDLESVPRRRQQTGSDFQPEYRGRDVATRLSKQFDRIRHPKPLQYEYSDSPSRSIGLRRREVKDPLTPSGVPQRFELRRRPHANNTAPNYMSERKPLHTLPQANTEKESLSNRIDKLEKVISENRTKSNERLEKVLSEVMTDSSRISAKEDIKRLRDSIKPRLNPAQNRSPKPESFGMSDAPGLTGRNDSSGRQTEFDPYIISPQSSDSYIGLPPSSDRQNNQPSKGSTSQSFSTYRSSEPGLIIRNEFYGRPGYTGPQPRLQVPSHPYSPPVSHHLTSLDYPRANHQLNVIPKQTVPGERATVQPQYFPNTSNLYYEHFPGRIYPREVPSYQRQQYYSNPDMVLQSPPVTKNQDYLWAGAPQRQPERIVASQRIQSFEPGYSLREGIRNHREDLPKKLTRDIYSPELSTDSDMSFGLELSVDENGILWDEELADTTGISEDLDSFRLSPSGSETAGDVDSSLLLSGSGSQPVPGKADNHRPTLEEIAETDEESSYCGLPGDTSGKLHDHLRTRRGDTSIGREGHLKTDKGGMVSDIVSVRDKMMKFLDEDDLKGRRPPSHTADSKQPAVQTRFASNKVETSGTGRGDESELNNSQAKQKRNGPISRISSDVVHNRLESSKGSNLTFNIDSDDDHSSSSYTPIKPSGSNSKFKRSDSFDLDADNNLTSEVKKPPLAATVGSAKRQEVVEEPIQQQCKSRDNKFDISRKLNLMSSSSESLDQSPRRKPVAKKRVKKDDNTNNSKDGHTLTGTDKVDGHKQDENHSQTAVQADVHAGSEAPDPMIKLQDLEKDQHQQQTVDTSGAPGGKSFDNKDSVPVGDEVRHENTEQQDRQKEILKGKEESGLTSSLDSLDDLGKYDNVPLKKAQPLRPTFADEATTDDEKSRDSIHGNPGSSPAVYKEESTDFDFESDLERFSTPLTMSKFGHKGKTKKNKVLTHKKARGLSSSRRLSIPKLHTDESSDGTSDNKTNRHRHEAAKRRRVALFCVFHYLDTRTLSQMALVCREWRHVSRHPELWKRVELKNERISSSFLVIISKWCSRLQHLTLEGLQCRQRRSSESLDEYHQNTRASLEPGLEEVLKCCQDSITSLQIIACGNLLTDKCLWLVSCYGRLLESLHYVSSTDPVSAEVLWAIGGGCPGVTELVVPPLFPCLKPKSFTNKCLVLIAKFYPDLLELGVGGQEISIGGLLPLVQGCQRLQYLQLDHMSELTTDDVTALCRAGLRNLSVLELNSSPIAPDAVKQMYKSCRHLKRMRILINFHDYFEDASKKKNREEYKKKVEKLQDLLKQPGLGSVLKVHAAPME